MRLESDAESLRLTESVGPATQTPSKAYVPLRDKVEPLLSKMKPLSVGRAEGSLCALGLEKGFES